MYKILILLTIFSLTRQQSTDVVFDLVDLSTNYYDPVIGTIFLEAYKSSKNDLIMSKKDVDNYGQLKWLSIGYPNLVKTLNTTTNTYQLFTMKPEGFEVAVEMLTDKHRKLFVDLVKSQYKIDINLNQIVSLIPAKFECQIILYNDNNKIFINGKVNQLTRLPFRMTFQAPLKSKERIYFEERLKQDKDKLDLEIPCQIYSQGQEYRENTLIIKGEQINQLGVVEEIFGDGTEKYVSRNQISSLSSKLYQRLSIIEDYKIAETEFKQNFIEEFIKQTYSVIINQYVPIDQALSQLSKYDLSEDLKPTVLKNEYSKVFFVNKTGSKEYLQLNTTQYEKLNTESSSNSEKSAKGSYKLFNLEGSAKYTSNQKSDWQKLNIGFSEQLSELNKYSENEIEWARSGNIVIPKSLRVSRLSKSNFKKDLTFVRIKRNYYDAPFKEEFYLETKSVLEVPQQVLDNTQKLNLLEEKTRILDIFVDSMNKSLYDRHDSLEKSLNTITDIKITNQNKTFFDLLEKNVNSLNLLINSRINALPNFIMQKGSFSITGTWVRNPSTKKFYATFSTPFKYTPKVFYTNKVVHTGDGYALLHYIGNEVISTTGFSIDISFFGSYMINEWVLEWIAFGY